MLVYADMNSEPVSHFLGYARLARVQAVFWGNPITTGKIIVVLVVSVLPKLGLRYMVFCSVEPVAFAKCRGGKPRSMFLAARVDVKLHKFHFGMQSVAWFPSAAL